MMDKPQPLTPAEREAIIESVISSQALSGIAVSREDAERWMDEVLAGPLPELIRDTAARRNGDAP